MATSASAVSRADTRPAATKTNFAHPKCYARCLNDCDTTSSKEHYISRSILLELGVELDATSPKYEGTRKLAAVSLQSHILCKRHNGALSPIDAHALELFCCLKSKSARVESNGGSDFFSGHDFEKWLLKVACGFGVLDSEPPPDEWCRILFGEADLEEPRGLQLNFEIGDQIPIADDLIALETPRNNDGERLGFAVTLCGFRFILSMSGGRLGDALGRKNMYRPFQLRWKNVGTRVEYRIGFVWEPPTTDGLMFEYKSPAKYA
jgi:hypothetical protein